MSARFTPGPWKAEPMVPLADNAFYITATPDGNNSEKDIGTVGPCLAKTTAPNARLIAAAPELHNELARMVDHFEAFANDHSMDASSETWSALHCAKAALAKARGEA